MSTFEVWLKSFDVRLEASRQGGVLCSAVLAAFGLWAENAGILASPARARGGGWAVVAFASLIAGVAFAAAAHLDFGRALTQAALEADQKHRDAVHLGQVNYSGLLARAILFGAAEIACIALGLLSAALSILWHR